MRKIILSLFLTLCMGISANAEIQSYRATSYAFASINQYTGKYTWTDWYKCGINIYINTSTDVITIYSNKTQTYYVVEYEGTYIDSSGGKQISFKVIDQDRDRGTVRLRIERNGNSQLYVDFADCAWVYNVYRQN